MLGLPLLMVLTCALQAEPAGLTLRGTVEDATGQPLAGARVDIATAAPRVGRGLFCPSCYRDCQKKTRTDEKGQFEIGGLDPALKFNVLVSMPGKKARLTGLVDPLEQGLKVALSDLPKDLPPERTLRGQVVDDQGLVIEGALIEPAGAKSVQKRWWGQVDGVEPTVTDNEGRFVMPLPEGYQGVDIQVTADGHSGASIALLAPGVNEHRLVVPRGTRVVGQLVHEGKPVTGARIAVVQTERSADHHFIKAVGDVTAADGKFVFDYLPAIEPYVIFSVAGEGPQEFVVTTKRFNAFGDGQERNLGTLEAIPAVRLAGRLESTDGQALPPDAKIVLDRNPAWDLIAVPVAEDGHFEINGLPPEAFEVRLAAKGFDIDARVLPYQVLSDRSLGLRLVESIDDLRIPVRHGSEPSSEARPQSPQRTAQHIPLGKSDANRGGFLTGRVLKGDQPRADVRMKLFRTEGSIKNQYQPAGETRTDADGRYSIGGLKTGDRYYFEIVDPERLVAPGWSHQMPFVQTLADDQQETRLPDVHLLSARQTLRGRVVNLQGKGVSGLSVSAQMRNGDHISRPTVGPPPWTKTDASGHFELKQLPDGLIELMVWRANPEGGPIRYPAKARPRMNQDDIRIVFDPSLADGIESLDAPINKTAAGTALPVARAFNKEDQKSIRRPPPAVGEPAVEGPAKPISGTVTDTAGNPIPNAQVWLPAKWLGPAKTLTVHATCDEQGHFKLDVPGDKLKMNTIVWAYAPNHSIGTTSVYQQLYGDKSQEPCRIELGAISAIAFQVLLPDGKPAEAVNVEPEHFRTQRAWDIIPAEMLPHVSSKTDARGRAALPALTAEGLYDLNIMAPGLGKQHFSVQARKGEPSEGTLQLKPVGRIEGRVATDNLELVRNMFVSIETAVPRIQAPREAQGAALVYVDEQGRFSIPEIAEGPMRVFAKCDEQLAVRPRLPQRDDLEVVAGQTTHLEISLETAVKVHGVIRVKGTGQPLAGARISVRYGVGHQGDTVFSDENGNYSAYALAGPVYTQVIQMPGDFQQLGEPWKERIEVPNGVSDFELPPIEVVSTIKVEGRLLDREGKPLTKARVNGVVGNRRYGFGETDQNGAFSIARVPTEVTLEKFEAWSGEDRLETEVESRDPLVLRVK